MRVPSRIRPARILLSIALTVLAAGCSQLVPGRATAATQPPTAAVAAPTPLPTAADAVGGAAAAALQGFWREEFPQAFGDAWTDIAVLEPVHTTEPGAPAPPCARRAADLTGQAFYCPAADAVVWDADGLAPDLHEQFGAAGVVVVLAHEVGHAVQTRLGIDEAQAAAPDRYPTILLEAMADCYAGVALAHLAEQPVEGLPVGAGERDDALLALVGFRDPLGTDPGDVSAHGNAFDRVSAFQDGVLAAGDTAARGGAARCAEMSMDNRVFTQRRFGSAADRARGGNLPLSRLLAAVGTDSRGWFATAVLPGWQAPPLTGSDGCPERALAAQGPVRFCAADGAVSIDRAELGALHGRFGDYAGVTLVVSRYGLAALDAAGADTAGPAASAAAVCLAGAYMGRLIDRDGVFSLSPGDLDEAVQVLLAGDWAARDDRGRAQPGEFGFDRLARFRTGLLEGAAGCLPP